MRTRVRGKGCRRSAVIKPLLANWLLSTRQSLSWLGSEAAFPCSQANKRAGVGLFLPNAACNMDDKSGYSKGACPACSIDAPCFCQRKTASRLPVGDCRSIRPCSAWPCSVNGETKCCPVCPGSESVLMLMRPDTCKDGLVLMSGAAVGACVAGKWVHAGSALSRAKAQAQ